MDTMNMTNLVINNSKFYDFLRVLTGFILLLPVDLEQLLNGTFALNWPICVQLLIYLQLQLFN